MDVMVRLWQLQREVAEGAKCGNIELIQSHRLAGLTGGDAMQNDGGNLLLQI
jgi:hypothetical protein